MLLLWPQLDNPIQVVFEMFDVTNIPQPGFLDLVLCSTVALRCGSNLFFCNG